MSDFNSGRLSALFELSFLFDGINEITDEVVAEIVAGVATSVPAEAAAEVAAEINEEVGVKIAKTWLDELLEFGSLEDVFPAETGTESAGLPWVC